MILISMRLYYLVPDGRGLCPRSYALIMHACLATFLLSVPLFLGFWDFHDFDINATLLPCPWWSWSLPPILCTDHVCLSRCIPFVWTL